jgi:hypothetical protein
MLLQHFRMKAPSLARNTVPPRGDTDQWLFLAQHVGLPTRLLDWTEGLFFALYFALYDSKGRPRTRDGATVWMLNPLALNRLSDPASGDQFPLTWFNHPDTHSMRGEVVEWFGIATDPMSANKTRQFRGIRERMVDNIGSANIRLAWGGADLEQGLNCPSQSIQPQSTHGLPRNARVLQSTGRRRTLWLVS